MASASVSLRVFRYALFVATFAVFVAAGCSDDVVDNLSIELDPNIPSAPLSLTSQSGCLIDSDCDRGLFCFQNQCTWECSDDTGCGEGERCSEHGRCISLVREASLVQTLKQADEPEQIEQIDEEDIGAAPTQLPAIGVAEAPPAEVQVVPGEPFVEVTLTTTRPVEEGTLLYRVELDGDEGVPQSMRANGSTVFTFTIPTGRAAGTDTEDPMVQQAALITPVGGYIISLIPERPLDGIYAGEVDVREFGGSSIPLRFGLRLEPEGASFEDAEARFVILPTSPQDVFAPLPGDSSTWVESQMQWDPQAEVWFARFVHDYAPEPGTVFALSGDVVRAMRIEIGGIDDDGFVNGALADRWQGLFDARSADGVVTPGSVVLSGRMRASRVSPLPGDARQAQAATTDLPPPQVGDVSPVTQCGEGVFEAMRVDAQAATPEGVEPACSNISNVDFFESAPSQRRAECALALGEVALSGVSTADQVRAFLDDDTPNPGGLSFGDFLERCAARDGYCVPSPELLCAEELLASAYQAQGSELSEAGELLTMYQDVAREGYLGRQLAAFQVDTTIRLDWLRTSIAPLFLASALRDFNETILDRWEEQVLDAHFEVLARQFAPSGLETLARTPTDPEALAVRRQFLLEQTQTWQGAMDALQIAATRWNAIYQNGVQRLGAQRAVESRMFDLYLSAAVLAQLSRSSGSAGTSAVFGSGFAALLRSLEELSLPFNDLIFMRDAEVVVSRSVDPRAGATTLLSDLEGVARRAVRDAQQSVDRVIAEAQRDALTEQVLTDRLETQAEEFAAELVELCGLPRGCDPADVGIRDECAVDVEVGRCGFVIDAESGQFVSFDEMSRAENVSQAGQAMLAYREAVIAVDIAEEEFRANQERAQIQLENADAFAANVQSWNRQRRQVSAEVDRLLNESDVLFANQQAAELDALRAQQQARETAYATQEAQVERWSQIRSDGIDSDMSLMTSINALQQTTNWLTLAGDETDRLAEAAADGLPKAAGTSNDVSAPARFVIRMSAYGVTTGLRAVGQTLQTIGDGIALSLEEQEARRDAELSNLEDLADLAELQTENQLEDIAASLRRIELRTEAEIATRESLIEALQRNLELDLAHERDLAFLRDRRDAVRITLTESMRLRTEVLRAEVVAARRHQEYMQIVQQAQLLEGRYASLLERLNNLDVLIASPSVIFAFANRLARAESRIDRAKRLMFDWLVALEYYAVRPFIDQRLAILLARNPSQLEAIADEMVRLQRVCGGNINREQVDLSVRDDLLEQNFDRVLDTGEVLDAQERFLDILARGNVPISTRVRYSTDERIGDVIRSRDVFAASFALRLEDFANLPLTCNAKIESVDVQLVGEGLGSARPTVSLLYDGTSALRSCQPNIDEIVGALDPGTTSFATVTSLRTAGRSVSPVAGLNTFGAQDSANRGLEGLPLSSTYTILIDPQQGENARIDWTQLEDIRLRINYVYQDLFPEGQCQ